MAILPALRTLTTSLTELWRLSFLTPHSLLLSLELESGFYLGSRGQGQETDRSSWSWEVRPSPHFRDIAAKDLSRRALLKPMVPRL